MNTQVISFLLFFATAVLSENPIALINGNPTKGKVQSGRVYYSFAIESELSDADITINPDSGHWVHVYIDCITNSSKYHWDEELYEEKTVIINHRDPGLCVGEYIIAMHAGFVTSMWTITVLQVPLFIPTGSVRTSYIDLDQTLYFIAPAKKIVQVSPSDSSIVMYADPYESRPDSKSKWTVTSFGPAALIYNFTDYVNIAIMNLQEAAFIDLLIVGKFVYL